MTKDVFCCLIWTTCWNDEFCLSEAKETHARVDDWAYKALSLIPETNSLLEILNYSFVKQIQLVVIYKGCRVVVLVSLF